MGVDQGDVRILGVHQESGETKEIAVDKHSGAPYFIGYQHGRTHDGQVYECSNRFIDINNDATREILIVNPASNEVHVRNYLFRPSGTPGQVDLYKGTTVSANGSAIDVRNRNQRSTKTNNLDIYTGPTVTDAGTNLGTIGITGGQQSGGLGQDHGVEWILENDTTYLLRYTNLSGGILDYVWFSLSVREQ